MDTLYIDYRDVVTLVEAEFARNLDRHGDRIQCGRGCSACCSQLFRITLLDAAQISRAVKALPPERRAWLQQRTKTYLDERMRLTRGVDHTEEREVPTTGLRLPCPALENGACQLYDARPVVCRKWGIPLFDPYHPDSLQACELNFPPGTEIADEELDTLIERQTDIAERWQLLKARVTDLLKPESPATTIAEAILFDYDEMTQRGMSKPERLEG